MSDDVTHDLKCWPGYFDAVLVGLKTFEVRKDDGRFFAVGDTLRLREWDPVFADGTETPKGYTGRECFKEVTYVLGLAPWCGDQARNVVVMGLRSAKAIPPKGERT